MTVTGWGWSQSLNRPCDIKPKISLGRPAVKGYGNTIPAPRNVLGKELGHMDDIPKASTWTGPYTPKATTTPISNPASTEIPQRKRKPSTQENPEKKVKPPKYLVSSEEETDMKADNKLVSLADLTSYSRIQSYPKEWHTIFCAGLRRKSRCSLHQKTKH